MSVQEELQRLLVTTMTGSASLMALIDGVHDRPPLNPLGARQAYIRIGSSAGSDDSAECIAGSSVVFQIDVFAATVGGVGCRRIVDLVRRLFRERGDLSLSENALVECRVVLWTIRPDPDGLTTHGVVQVEFLVEEPD